MSAAMNSCQNTRLAVPSRTWIAAAAMVPGLQRLGVPKQDAQDESQAVRLDETDAGIGSLCDDAGHRSEPEKDPAHIAQDERPPDEAAASRKVAFGVGTKQ
jgi:hypothetical protein